MVTDIETTKTRRTLRHENEEVYLTHIRALYLRGDSLTFGSAPRVSDMPPDPPCHCEYDQNRDDKVESMKEGF